jgi:hypothetical protein
MKIKDIRLLDIEVRQKDNLIFEGRVENAPQDILNLEIISLKFDSKKLIIHVDEK